MALQFKQKSQLSRIQQLQQQAQALNNITKDLQKQNQAKQKECMILQQQINQLKREQLCYNAENKTENKTENECLMSSSQYLDIIEQYKQITQECIDIKIKYDRLLEQFQEVQSHNKQQQNKQNQLKKDIEVLKKVVRSRDVTIQQLQFEKEKLIDELQACQKQLSELQNHKQYNKSHNSDIMTFMNKIEQIEKELSEKRETSRYTSEKQKELSQKIEKQALQILSLQKELKTKKEALEIIQNEGSASNNTLHYQILVLQTKNSDLKRQVAQKQQLQQELWAKEEQIRRMTQDEGKAKDYEVGISMLQIKIEQLEANIKSKEMQLTLKQTELAVPNDQTSSNTSNAQKVESQLIEKDFLISRYKEKINVLSQELDRLVHKIKDDEKKEIIREIQLQQKQILQNKLERLETKYIQVQNQIVSLNEQNQSKLAYLRDLQRRYSMLQEGNMYLESEMRRLAQEGKSTLRLLQNKNQQDEAYKQVILSLRSELEHSKQLNNLIRNQRDELQTQLQQTKSRFDSIRTAQKDRGMSHSSLIVNNRISKMDKLSYTPKTADCDLEKIEYEPISPLDYNLYQKSSHTSEPHERFSDLEMRIKELQSENYSLKHPRY